MFCKKILSVFLLLISVILYAETPQLRLPEITEGNKVNVFYNSEPIYSEIKKLFQNAEKSIRLDFYIFYGDEANQMTDILIEKAKKGVEIRVIFDKNMGALPMIKTPMERTLKKLKALNLKNVIAVKSANNRLKGKFRKSDHNKNIIIDEKIGMVGGMNVGDRFKNFHDIMVEFEGPVVKQLLYWFERDFCLASSKTPEKCPSNKEDFSNFENEDTATPGTTSARVITMGPGRGDIFEIYKEQLKSAKESIDVQMSEFTGDTFINLLLEAHNRGVKVRAMVDPDKNIEKFLPVIGKNFSGIINAGAVEKMIGAGIEVRFFPVDDVFERSHAKLAIFDGKIINVGSANWSEKISNNFETNIELHMNEEVEILQQTFDHFWDKAEKAKMPPKKILFLHNLIKPFI